MFEINHRVQFYETDLMGIVHHANYLRLFEEARVAWGQSCNLIDWTRPETASDFTVLSTEVRHIKPSRFGDNLRIQLQVKMQGVRVVFEYKMWNEQELIAECRTTHVRVDQAMKVQRPTHFLLAQVEKEKWNETWLLNL